MPITAALAPPPPGGFPTGLLPSPRHVLAAAKPFYSPWAPPVSQFALVPKQLDYWGNNQYGDCVSAEEAFRCACDNPEDFIPASVVIDWARKHGVLNGADLPDVLDKQARGGFTVGQNTYNAGGKQTVDYSNEATLRSALCMGPVKLGMDHAALPSGAGNQQGWYALGTGRSYRSEDHCTALCGFGPAGAGFTSSSAWRCRRRSRPTSRATSTTPGAPSASSITPGSCPRSARRGSGTRTR
jgi:hypothetical protein